MCLQQGRCGGVVFDDEHTAARTGLPAAGGGAVSGGQVDSELGTVAELGLQVAATAVCLCEAAGQRQAEAGAAGTAALVTGLLELVEDPALVRDGDARPGVSDGDRDIATDPADRDEDPSAV